MGIPSPPNELHAFLSLLARSFASRRVRGGLRPEGSGSLLGQWFERCCGSEALSSQKSLMLFTRFSKASNCTGLLR
jgi:hypothetical protein